LLLRHVREGRGERIACLTSAGGFTYAQLAALAEAWAEVFAAAALASGHRVLLALEDGPTLWAALFGALAHGAVVVPVSPALTLEEHLTQITYVRPQVVVAESERAESLRHALATSGHLGQGDAVSSLRVLEARQVPSTVSENVPRSLSRLAAASHASGRDEAIWLMTSGSTGQPRAVVHTHEDFLFSAEHYARQVLGIRADDIFLGVPKIFFGYGTGMSLVFPLVAGATAVLYPGRPTAERLCELAALHRPTVLALVPRMLARLLEMDASVATRALASVRVAVSAGEALPETLYRRFRDVFGFEVVDGIGSAEMFHIYLSQRPGEVEPSRVGRLVPGYEARVVRPDGSDAAADEPGRLWVRGGSAGRAYAFEPEQTAAVFREDGWVVSGDFLSRSAEGLFTYQGRADDMLKVGGIYVSPVEVENVLLAHPEVSECAVAGYTDAAGLQRARAFVVPKDPARLAASPTAIAGWTETLAAHARASLAGYKVPDRWDLLPALPRSDRGKLLRRALTDASSPQTS
jgi:benzoate-CoA ligase family protein